MSNSARPHRRQADHQAPPSLGFSRQEHWSGLPFPSPMHESESASLPLIMLGFPSRSLWHLLLFCPFSVWGWPVPWSWTLYFSLDNLIVSHDFKSVPWWLSGKESACNSGDPGSSPGLGRSPGEGNGNPLQYSCLENPRNGGAWWADVYRVAQSQTRLKWVSSSSSSMLVVKSGNLAV